jgi:DNA-binding MurR/RpiR family transcriptional regulator
LQQFLQNHIANAAGFAYVEEGEDLVTVSEDLLQRIKAKYGDLSTAQKSIAQYLLDNYEKAAFLTAGQLGTLVGVSESTVVRFANTLGYGGYPHLQKEMQEHLKRELTTVSRLQQSPGKLRGPSLVHQILENDIKNLRRTMEEISPEVFDRVVEEIGKAPNIFIIGNRSAHCLALFLAMYLELLGKRVKAVPTGVTSIFEQLAIVQTEDLVIGISFPRYTSKSVEGFEYAARRGARTVAITDSVISPLAQLADLTLIAKSDLNSFIEAFAAPLSLITALATAVGMRERENVLRSLEHLEEIWDNYRIFYHGLERGWQEPIEK